jgi:hypothetical protein
MCERFPILFETTLSHHISAKIWPIRLVLAERSKDLGPVCQIPSTLARKEKFHRSKRVGQKSVPVSLGGLESQKN